WSSDVCASDLGAWARGEGGTSIVGEGGARSSAWQDGPVIPETPAARVRGTGLGDRLGGRLHLGVGEPGSGASASAPAAGRLNADRLNAGRRCRSAETRLPRARP